MRAVAIRNYGGPEVLEAVEMPMPDVAVGEVLVRVRAAAVNPADWKWRTGMFAAQLPVRFPHILGYDIAGEIVSGPRFSRGARVAAMLNPITKGGYAEYAAVPWRQIACIPDRVTFESAAALPTAGLTGTQMIEALATKAGDVVMITGATGAVGRFALLAARRLSIRTIAAVRHSQIAEALCLGADEAIDLSSDWPGEPLDHVVDTIGGPLVGRLCRHLRPAGTILTAATTPIDCTGLHVTPGFFAVQPSGEMLQRLLDLVAETDFAVPIAKVLPLAEAARAHRLVERGGTGGKIILRP